MVVGVHVAAPFVPMAVMLALGARCWLKIDASQEIVPAA